MADSLRLYDKDVQERFPNKRVGKHIVPDELNKAINEFIESGDQALGVELIRYLHWDSALHRERSNIISEQVMRFYSYEHYIEMEEELDFNMIQQVTWNKFKTEVLNRLYFIFRSQESLSYKELKNLLSVMDLK